MSDFFLLLLFFYYKNVAKKYNGRLGVKNAISEITQINNCNKFFITRCLFAVTDQ